MAAIDIRGTTTLKEAEDSPKYNITDRSTVVQRYTGSFADCLAGLPARGTAGGGSLAGWMVSVASAERTKGDRGGLTITWEPYLASSGQSLPPDGFTVEKFEINPDLSKHPFFADLDEDDYDAVDEALNSPNRAARSVERNKIESNAFYHANTAAFLDKKIRGTDSFYLAGIEYRWTRYYWAIEGATLGGFIQHPDDFDSSHPLFGFFTGVDFLREADVISREGWMVKVDRTWKGAPAGFWDTDLYGA